MCDDKIDLDNLDELNNIINQTYFLRNYILKYIKLNFKKSILKFEMNPKKLKDAIVIISKNSLITKEFIIEFENILERYKNNLNKTSKNYIDKMTKQFKNHNVDFNISDKIISMLAKDIKNNKFARDKASIIGNKVYNYFLLKKFLNNISKQITVNDSSYDFDFYDIGEDIDYEDIIEEDTSQYDDEYDNDYHNDYGFKKLEKEAEKAFTDYICKIDRIKSPSSVTESLYLYKN